MAAAESELSATTLAERLADFRRFRGEAYDSDSYGVAWVVDSTSPRRGTVTYAHVLSNGRPSQEFRVTWERDFEGRPMVESVSWVFEMDGFRDEAELDGDDFDLALEFYEAKYGDAVVLPG